MTLTYLATFLYEQHKGKTKKGKIDFFPDAYNNGWSKQHDTQMNLRICGTFTYSNGGEGVRIMHMYLKKTEPMDDLYPLILLPDRTTVNVSEWVLLKDRPEKIMVDIRLKPVIGTPNSSLHAKLVLKDNTHREFVVGEVDLPYLGRHTGV